MKLDLHPGDLFGTSGKGILATCIQAVQWFWSTDNEAPYNHVGFIVDPDGDTLEARWRFKYYLLEQYVGNRLIIVRHKDMDHGRFLNGLAAVQDCIGNIYPVYRLFLHLFRLAKFLHFGPGVCSEMTGMFMKGAGFKNIVYGLTPDDLVDRWKIDKDMEIIFEGILEKGMV